MPPDREPNLENELRDLGPRIEYPTTPDLASSVKDRLEAEDHTPVSPSGPSLWWLAAAALVLLTALPVLSLVVGGGMGGAGSMAGGAGGGGSENSGEQAAGGSEAGNGPTALSAGGAQAGSAAGAASVTSGEAATAFPAAGAEAGSSAGPSGRRVFGEGLGLGERITPREARARSDAPVLLPRSPVLGRPDEVYDRTGSPGFVYLYRDAYPRLPGLDDTRIGLLLTQTPGDAKTAYLPDGAVEGSDLDAVSVNGAEGYWVPASGDAPEIARSAGLLAGVLLWEREGQALRLEADVPKAEAVRIAESVR